MRSGTKDSAIAFVLQELLTSRSAPLFQKVMMKRGEVDINSTMVMSLGIGMIITDVLSHSFNKGFPVAFPDALALAAAAPQGAPGPGLLNRRAPPARRGGRRFEEASMSRSTSGFHNLSSLARLLGACFAVAVLSLMAVFIPVSFMPGIAGRFLRSFGLTMAFSIGVSQKAGRALDHVVVELVKPIKLLAPDVATPVEGTFDVRWEGVPGATRTLRGA